MAYVEYTLTTIDVPGATGTEVDGIGLFGADHIAGTYTDSAVVTFGLYGASAHVPHLFDDNNGTITTFAPSNLLLETRGVNDAGQIVGEVHIDDPQTFPYGFIYQAGTLTFLHVVGADETEVNGINAFDQITGTFVASEYHGFLSNLTSGAFDVLPEAPNGGFTTPTGLNTAGQVVGTYFENHSGVEHGFIYDNGTFSNIDFPGAQETEPMGINDFSQVVGNYFDGQTEHGFLDDGGSFVYFDIPGAIATRNTGINDYGQIVGFYNDVSGHSHGFLLTPIPGSTPAPSRRVGVNDTVSLLRSIANSGPAERPDLRSLLRAVSRGGFQNYRRLS